MIKRPEIIAYYLPQFHPFPENDNWWGKGFTEWTNVAKAKPLYPKHYQPKIPADLGFYDLRLPIVRKQQVELAREAGITAFCYWHYWFGNGKQLLNEIIDDVHETGDPDFPFCLGWANESWKAKVWNKNGAGDKVLVEQVYGDEKEYRKHFEYVKELFKDKRYYRVNGHPFFLIYKPQNFPQIATLIQMWNKWVKEEGIAEKIYFVGNLDLESNYDKYINIGFDALTPGRARRVDYNYVNKKRWIRAIILFFRTIKNIPVLNSYKRIYKHIWISEIDSKETSIPFIIPNWDHTPRSGRKGSVIIGSTPELFRKQTEKVIRGIINKKNPIIMLKSWNEWAEGNYMEPDLRWGKEYIKALHEAIENTCIK